MGKASDACSMIRRNSAHLTWINDHGAAAEEAEGMRPTRHIARLLQLQQITSEAALFHCDNIIMSRHIH
ncbi:hypothetical protein [Bradyrhizobium sp. SRS-191]|uniref:hypothetical protein n=1 Tax=Bradyrhizobium sp. SRS-191 TaxID=2962606 RepID=UPI00211ECCFC|nr:hypothetical protein [Bradyrhizobium sp. SRS-191]